MLIGRRLNEGKKEGLRDRSRESKKVEPTPDGVSEVKQQTNRTAKLRTERPRDHVVASKKNH